MKAAARSSMARAVPAEEGQRGDGRAGPGPLGRAVRAGGGGAAAPLPEPRGTGGSERGARRRPGTRGGAGAAPSPIGRRGGARAQRRHWPAGAGRARGRARGLARAAAAGSGTEAKGGGQRGPLPARRAPPAGQRRRRCAASPEGTGRRHRAGEPGRRESPALAPVPAALGGSAA